MVVGVRDYQHKKGVMHCSTSLLASVASSALGAAAFDVVAPGMDDAARPQPRPRQECPGHSFMFLQGLKHISACAYRRAMAVVLGWIRRKVLRCSATTTSARCLVTLGGLNGLEAGTRNTRSERETHGPRQKGGGRQHGANAATRLLFTLHVLGWKCCGNRLVFFLSSIAAPTMTSSTRIQRPRHVASCASTQRRAAKTTSPPP